MNEEYLQDLLIRMAHHSTAIEGNSFTQGEVKSIIVLNYVPRAAALREVNEVLNYKKLMPWLSEHQKEDITIQGIKDINQILLTNIDSRGGHFKVIQNMITGADFETVHPYMVPEEIKKWTDDLSWRLKQAKTEREKVEIIMDQHIRFERIHPFSDGNGRTGRALIIWSCLQQGLMPVVIKKEQRKSYINALNKKDIKELTEMAVDLQTEERKRKFIFDEMKADDERARRDSELKS